MSQHSNAWLDGWHAHRQGVSTDDNPYDELITARSYHQWVAGWCARFSAIKRGQDTSLDEELFND
jgi:ribosome modulation factor